MLCPVRRYARRARSAFVVVAPRLTTDAQPLQHGFFKLG
jgi:hypothetical protein